MIKIEAETLELAYQNAASELKCSVTALEIQVVQSASKGFLGLFKKPAIIVAAKNVDKDSSLEEKKVPVQEKKKQEVEKQVKKEPKKSKKTPQKKAKQESPQRIVNDTIMPTSFVSMQDDEEEYDVASYLADYDEDDSQDLEEARNIAEIACVVKEKINELFNTACFKIEAIDVCVYDENTLLVEFTGEDAALLIGKEGYRYKALSYMLFNWINTKYQVQLRLEIAEFLKNQEESICKYLVGICDTVEKDGRAQTKILDGVLVQIALKELRERYPDKYIVIRSTRDGLKYIIVNDYHSS